MLDYIRKVLWSFDVLYPGVKYFILMCIAIIPVGGLLAVCVFVPSMRQVIFKLVCLMFIIAIMERLYVSIRIWHNLAELPRNGKSFEILLRDKRFDGDEYVVYLLNTTIIYSNSLDKLLCIVGYLPLLLFNIISCLVCMDISTLGKVFWKYKLDMSNQIFDKALNIGKGIYRHKVDYMILIKYVRENGLSMNIENYREFLIKIFG